MHLIENHNILIYAAVQNRIHSVSWHRKITAGTKTGESSYLEQVNRGVVGSEQ